MYIGHGRLCVCLSLAAFPHYCTDSYVTWGMVESQIPLRYLVAHRFEAGRGPVADLLARASSLLAS